VLTAEQQKWIDHLSTEDTIRIVPYDPRCKVIYETVKKRIQKEFGTELPVEHHGASSLGISGQDEIDIFIPVVTERFTPLVGPLSKFLGVPKSWYQNERVRFKIYEDSKKIDLFLVNSDHYSWIDTVVFERLLREKPELLDEYRLLKEDGDGLSVREYYRRKTEFINKVISC
jgi:GrpB-like predicted nucleotidyltransferase (UPF0157 family)